MSPVCISKLGPEFLLDEGFCVSKQDFTCYKSTDYLGFPPLRLYTIQEVYSVAQSLISRGREEREHGPANIQSGWALIGAYISLGELVYRSKFHLIGLNKLRNLGLGL